MEQKFFPEPLYPRKGRTAHSGKEKAELIAHHTATWRLPIRHKARQNHKESHK